MIGNLEYALITRVLETRDFRALDQAQITDDYFSIPECREGFKYIRDMYRNPHTSGEVPSMELFRSRFLSFYPVQGVIDAVSVLADQLRLARLRVELDILAARVVGLNQTDPRQALQVAKQVASSLSLVATPSEDIGLADAVDRLEERYNQVQECKGIIGIPYPWDAVNEETRGMAPGEFIIFTGRPKNGKSWIICNIASHAYLHGMRRVLFYTREMTTMDVLERMACCVTKTDYDLYRKAKLPTDVKNRCFTMLRSLRDEESQAAAVQGIRQPMLKVISDKNMPNAGGVGWLSAKIEEYEPDLVIADGFYLMSDDTSGKKSKTHLEIANISRSMKALTIRYNIPIIGTSQINRTGDKTMGDSTAEVAFSDALGQDADRLWRVVLKEDFDQNTQRSFFNQYLINLAARDTKMDGFVLRYVPATDFSFHRAWVKATDNDDVDLGSSEKKSGRMPKRTLSAPMDPRIPSKM